MPSPSPFLLIADWRRCTTSSRWFARYMPPPPPPSAPPRISDPLSGEYGVYCVGPCPVAPDRHPPSANTTNNAATHLRSFTVRSSLSCPPRRALHYRGRAAPSHHRRAAAVDVDRAAGHIGGGVGNQEAGDVGELLGPAHPAQRHRPPGLGD